MSYVQFAFKGVVGCALLASCLALPGCTTPNAQALRAQQEKEQLTEVIRSQRDNNNALKERNETLAKRVDEAEKELAIAQGRGTRFSRIEPPAASTEPAGSTPIREPAAQAAPAATAKLAPEEKLPWRPSRTGSRPSGTNGSETR